MSGEIMDINPNSHSNLQSVLQNESDYHFPCISYNENRFEMGTYDYKSGKVYHKNFKWNNIEIISIYEIDDPQIGKYQYGYYPHQYYSYTFQADVIFTRDDKSYCHSFKVKNGIEFFLILIKNIGRLYEDFDQDMFDWDYINSICRDFDFCAANGQRSHLFVFNEDYIFRCLLNAFNSLTVETYHCWIYKRNGDMEWTYAKIYFHSEYFDKYIKKLVSQVMNFERTIDDQCIEFSLGSDYLEKHRSESNDDAYKKKLIQDLTIHFLRTYNNEDHIKTLLLK